MSEATQIASMGITTMIELMQARDEIKRLKEALANHIPDDTKMVSCVKDSLTTQQEQGEPDLGGVDVFFPVGITRPTIEEVTRKPEHVVIREAFTEANDKRLEQEQGEPVGQLLEEMFGRGQVMWFKKPEDLSMLYTQPQSKAEQEPVAFLANGTRFKISYDSRQSGGQIHGIPPELGGRWVAFVAADDDCHLKLTNPQPKREPLTDEQIMEMVFAECDNMRWPSTALYIARAIEAAHGIKE